MIKLRRIPILLSLVLFVVNSTSGYKLVSELRSMGYAVIPAPQKVQLSGENIVIDSSWEIVSEIADGHVTLNRIKEGALSLHDLTFSNSGSKRIILKINPNAFNDVSNKKCREQAYRLNITADKIVIEGSADAGLFYGVQSFLQLLKSNDKGKYKLPLGTIIDWPRLELRFIHWDSKHNRGRIKDLKRYIDWAAYFKVNAIAFEIEDKYEYPSHPVIGGPNALSKAEMVEITNYAHERFIQLVPNIQSPAHMGYVLKHEEFAHFRSDGSNYQLCLCDEEAIKLIQDIYQDIMDATPGVDYLFVSTDELYYPGICEKCSKPYTEENKSQYWADYVKTIHSWLNGRRKMLIWMEYPLLAKDIALLPSDIINGVTYPNRDQDFVDIEYEKGISQLSYSPLQGEEWLFPNYFPGKYRGNNISGRLNDVSDDIKGLLEIKNHLIGNFAAAWDDSGLHNETFWLGWISASQYAWNPYGPTVEQITADFMDLFYGTHAQNMTENYKLLQMGARFYQSSWELKDALNLPLIYGRHDSIYQFPRKRPVMITPELPHITNGIIKSKNTFTKKYNSIIIEAKRMKPDIDKLIASLYENLSKADRNKQNIEVLLSIAYLEKHFIDMILTLESAEILFTQAGDLSQNGSREGVIQKLQKAHLEVETLLANRKNMWSGLKNTWEKGRLPKNVNANRKPYVHILDDVKDHVADKTIGIEYMIEPMEDMQLTKWNKELKNLIVKY